MNRRDVQLAVLALAGPLGLEPAQLQKSLFLLGVTNLHGLPEDFYAFLPYHYGPFSKDVYDEADEAAREGLIEKIPQLGGNWSRYVTTPKGREQGELILSQFPQATQEYVRAIVKWIMSLSFADLIRTIYALYPEYRRNSVFVDPQ